MRAVGGPDVAVGDVLLSVENVSLSFGGLKAVSDVSFDIRKGEIRAIIGPNGAGKTSMLNVINGFYQPQKGRITFKGQTRAKMRPHDAAYGGKQRGRAASRSGGRPKSGGRPHATRINSTMLRGLFKRVPAQARRQRRHEQS